MRPQGRIAQTETRFFGDAIHDGGMACRYRSSSPSPLFCRLAVLLLALIIGSAPVVALGQAVRMGTIAGIVLDDSTHHLLPFVSVALRSSIDSTNVAHGVTNDAGRFQFADVPLGAYFIEFQLVGYEGRRVIVPLLDASHDDRDLGELRLKPVPIVLGRVQVNGEKQIYQMSIDRKVYNVGKDLASQTGSASDLLQSVPSVQVDIDGTVSLRGSSSVMILIDGKVSPLMNRSSAEVLQQLPANAISRIEVITNPSAKYTPEGTSGIINIVMNKNVNLGMNGSVSANAGNQDRYNSTLRLSCNPPALKLNGSYGIRRDSRNRVSRDRRSQRDSSGALTSFNEDLASYARPLSHTVSLGLEYQLDSADDVGASGDYFYNGFTRTDHADELLRDSSGIATNQFQRDRYDPEFEKEYSVATFFEHNFGDEDHTLRLDFNSSGAPEAEHNHYTNHFTVPVQPDAFDNTLIRATDDNRQLTLEYANALSDKSNLELGYNGEFNRSDLDFRVESFDTSSHQFVADAAKTNRFLHHESINAVYATYKRSIGALGFLTGLRAEHVRTNSDLVTFDSSLANSYSALYPSLHLSYKLTQVSELQLSYSRRTRRPDAEDLNPFPEYRDPRNVSAGNPKLMPEYVHSLELGCQFQKDRTSIAPALFYRYTYNGFTTVTQVINDTLSLTTRQNLSSDQSGGVEVVGSFGVADRIDTHVNASVYIDQINASNLGFGHKTAITTWSAAGTSAVNFGPATRIQLNATCNSSRQTPQGRYSPSFVLNVGVRQNLWGDRCLVVLTVTDVLKTLRRQLVLDTPALRETVVNRRDSRIAYLGVTFRFGAESKKAKEEPMRFEERI